MTTRALTPDGRTKLENALADRDLRIWEAAKIVGTRRENFSRWLAGQGITPKYRRALKREFGLADHDFDEPAPTRPPEYESLQQEIQVWRAELAEQLRRIECRLDRLDSLDPPAAPRRAEGNGSP